MTRGEAKQLVCGLVTEKQGCKILDLILPYYSHPGAEEHTIDSLVNELVEEDRLIEIEYVLPGMLYRIKSFLLPAGTDVTVNDPIKNRGA